MTSDQDNSKLFLNVHPFLEYIESVISSIPNFYNNTTLSLLTYRFLPELAQCIVNRLLAYSGPIPFQEVRGWFLPSHKAIQNKTLWRLKQLQILQGRGQEVWINEAFQKSLFIGFSKGKIMKLSSESNFDEIDDYARSKWELVLYELVKGESQPNPEGKRHKASASSLEKLLKDSGLITEGGRVTNSGFQFLLRDVSTQIWTLLIHFLRSVPEPKELEANLTFIGENVLFGCAGEIISRPTINVNLFEQFGLLMRREASSFCATRLFTSLTGVKNALDFSQTGVGSRGFLVVETNYRVYAYTSSPLQIATLAVFIRLQDRFPNLVYGQLDMEMVQNAMSHGISADQIIQYLQMNVHPCMKAGSSAGGVEEEVPFNGIPFTIVDQIKLWELNRNRLAHRDGFLYQQFLSEREFDAALTEAKNINALLYAKPSSRLLIVSLEGHDHMRQFLKSNK